MTTGPKQPGSASDGDGSDTAGDGDIGEGDDRLAQVAEDVDSPASDDQAGESGGLLGSVSDTAASFGAGAEDDPGNAQDTDQDFDPMSNTYGGAGDSGAGLEPARDDKP